MHRLLKFVEIINRVKTLTQTRASLRQSEYTQVPQLSVGLEMDLNQPLTI